jgi:hypothetical protein
MAKAKSHRSGQLSAACYSAPMPAKKTTLTDAERARRIRETAREIGTDNDPKSLERAFKKVVVDTKASAPQLTFTTIQKAIDWIGASSPSLDAVVYVSNPLSISARQSRKPRAFAPLNKTGI